MKGIIHYHFVGGMLHCAATLESAAYARGLTGFGATYSEARSSLVDHLIKPGIEEFVPPDEEIEF